MTEWGLFSDEGLVEDGFYSEDEALSARADRYTLGDGLVALEICRDHPEHPSRACEDCVREGTQL